MGFTRPRLLRRGDPHARRHVFRGLLAIGFLDPAEFGQWLRGRFATASADLPSPRVANRHPGVTSSSRCGGGPSGLMRGAGVGSPRMRPPYPASPALSPASIFSAASSCMPRWHAARDLRDHASEDLRYLDERAREFDEACRHELEWALGYAGRLEVRQSRQGNTGGTSR